MRRPTILRSDAADLAQCVHRHLLDTCPDCRIEWNQLGPRLQEAFDAELGRFTPPQPGGTPDENLLVDDVEIDAQAAFVADLRYQRRRAQEQFWKLRRLAPERRASTIRGAFRQYGGRALAELILDHCRTIVRNQPAEAAAWADLVPLVLDWTGGPGDPAWAPGLLVCAEAHRANALRICGDLAAADTIFHRLEAALASLPAADPALVAEVASLEASLRIPQRQIARAEALLAQAAAGYQHAGDPLGVVRVLIQQANLAWMRGDAPRTLGLFDDAAEALAPNADADLRLLLCTVTGRVLALSELGRFDDAARLLRRHEDDYEASDDPFTASLFRGLEGRVALGLGRFDRAEAALTSCRDGLLILGRHHDAALACLDLAEVLLAAGRADELAGLAGQLVPLFRSKKLPVETLRALDHLARAITARRLSAALLAELRRGLAGSTAWPAFGAA